MGQRLGMNTTSHNIANASTPGFSRQRVDLVASMPLPVQGGYIGTGVLADHIGRIRERFIDQQIRSSNDLLGDASAQYSILSQVEALVNEPSDVGLGNALNEFFLAFQNLAVRPEESSSRNAVLQQGTLLTQKFYSLNNSLTQLRDNLIDDVKLKIQKVNQLTKELSDLDIMIVSAAAVGSDPSDLKDSRDLKLEELSRLVNTKVSEDERGSIMVSVGGTVISSRGGAVALRVQVTGSQIAIVGDISGSEVRAPSGELGGAMKIYNTTLPDYMAKLDQIAATLISRVNTLHSGGRGLGSPAPTGLNFFTGTTAQSIAVNSSVLSNTDNIAASADGAPGNNQTAMAIAAVQNEKLMSGNSISISQFYNGWVSTIGASINSAEGTSKAQELVLQQMENQRNQVSSVSLDEEMVNLMKYQRAFDAAARVVATVDDLFQTILDMR
jgi:flagellar hook-associated protein 1 FlgK